MGRDFERVYAVTDYHDGILGGIADYLGKPHVFVLLDEGFKQELPRYSLAAVSHEVFTALTRDPFPMWKPPQAAWDLVDQTVKNTSPSSKTALGEFEPVGDIDLGSLEPFDVHVRWHSDLLKAKGGVEQADEPAGPAAGTP